MTSTSDLLQIAGSGVEAAGGALQLLSFVRNLAGANVISTYFRYDGTRVGGSDKIEVELHRSQDAPEIFWLGVKPLDDYVFNRIPLNASGTQELIGKVVGEHMHDPAFWRWVPLPNPNILVSGSYIPPNAKVDFLIVGYRPSALLKHFSSSK